FIGKFLFWKDGWDWALEFASNLPAFVFKAIDALANGISNLVDFYRATFYPIMTKIVDWIGIDIPIWSFDLIFIGLFSLLGIWRLRSAGSYIFREGLDLGGDYGFFYPILVMAEIGALTLNSVTRLVTLGSTDFEGLVYDNLPDPADDILCGAISIASFFGCFYVIEYTYISLKAVGT
ncbi:MAG: hypothetical protein AAGJ50_03635, partial [Pseudomonadota bacterium]